MRPNIIILFVDDMGFSDVGCFGGEIDTPNLDRLAANGLRLTQFYNTSRCCPSRASLLTGLYAHQAGIGMMVYRDRGKGYRGNLNDRCVTFGQLMQTAGYQTMLVGKWHAGHAPPSRPEVRGFEKFTGVYPHIDSYWKVLKSCDIYRDGKLLIPAGESPINPYNPTHEFYTTDFFTDVALDYINQAQQQPDRPFLLHVCYNVPHFPLEAPEKLIEKYLGRYRQGWDRLRREKFTRMKDLGVVGSDQKLPQLKGFANERLPGFGTIAKETDVLPSWESLSRQEQQELDFRRAIYAAQIDRFDQCVGRVVDHLKRHGILDNTLILFFSDNGCSGETGLFGMNWGKYTQANYRTWRKKGGWSISQGQCWAGYSNTPLRKYKKFVHEGGIASPFIAHWPAGIKQPGRIHREQFFHLIDIVPTLCDIASVSYPSEQNGKPVLPLEGISMLPYFNDPHAGPELPRVLYWQHENHAAIREGNWKLVTVNDRDDQGWELYDLSRDRSETEDVSQEKVELVKRLKTKWRSWASRSNVLPFPEQRNLQ